MTLNNSRSSLNRPESFITIAHRGGLVPEYPENTLMAFRKTIETGAEVIEIDLRSTKDAEIVVLHDSTLNRTTSGSGPITGKTLAEVKDLDAGGGEQVPTLQEVLELIAGTDTQLLLDLKITSHREVCRIVKQIENQRLTLNVILATRSIDELETIKNLNPNLRTLGFIPNQKSIKIFAEKGIDIIRLFPEWIHKDSTLIDSTHTLGRPVWAMSLTETKEALEKLLRYGVNGVFTDYPKMVSGLRQELRQGSQNTLA